MTLDPTGQIAAVGRFLGYQGTANDLISQGKGPFFHYTDYAAFAAIVTKNDLWLTDARFSNDAEELEHGRSLLVDAVRAESDSGVTAELRVLAADVLAEIEADVAGPEAVYVCCFCEKSDQLSQWRGYAANGGGVAIEIDPQSFGYIAGVDCPIGVMRFWKVFYEEADKRNKVRQVLNFWAAESDPPEDRAKAAMATLRFFVPTFKNSRFSEEAEWRLTFTPAPSCKVPPKFRTARGLLVPYYELTELVKSFTTPQSLAIKNVCVGPGPYKDVNARSARLLLDSYGFAQAAVVRSVIPYRGP